MEKIVDTYMMIEHGGEGRMDSGLTICVYPDRSFDGWGVDDVVSG